MNQCLTIFRFSASPYFDSVCSRQCRRHLVTHSLLILIIMINKKMIYPWFNSGGFQPRLGRERRYPYVKGCIFGASQKISWEQLVTCLAHSKEHCKTSLAEYWGRGAPVGHVTSRTTKKVTHCMEYWRMLLLSIRKLGTCEWRPIYIVGREQ